MPFGKLTVCHRTITQKWFILLIGKLYIWAVFPISNNQRLRNNQKWGMVRTCLLMIHRFSIYMSHAKGISVKNHLHVRSSCWTWQFFIGVFSQRGVSENRGFTLSSKAKKSYFIHWTLCFWVSPTFLDIFREPSNSSILNVVVAFPHGFSHWFFTIVESVNHVNHQGPQGPHVECSFPRSCWCWARRPPENS